MRRIPNLATFAVLSAALQTAACRDAGSAATSVLVDTLPGGILRTVSEHPVDSGRWTMRLARTVQPPEGDPAELLQPSDLALADDGSILVVERRPTHIKVFGPDGRFLRTIGRQGSGPGEFRSAYIAVLGDTLVTQDAVNARATSFNWRTGALLAERRTACCYFHPVGIDGSGRAVVRMIGQAPDSTWRNAQGFVRFAAGGTDVDSIFVQVPQSDPPPSWLVREGNRVMMSVGIPFQPRAIFAVDPTGTFLAGWTGDFSIRATVDGADTVSLFGRRAEPVPVTAEEKRQIIDTRVKSMADPVDGPSEAALRESFDVSLIPDVRPAFDGIAVDREGRRWVRRAGVDSLTVTLDLFDRDGRWLDVVSVHDGLWPALAWTSVAWSENGAAVLAEDEDGRPLIRVFAIERR